MTTDLISQSDNLLAATGQEGNRIAGTQVFEDYRARRSENTRRRQENDLALFASFLRSTGLEPGDFVGDPAAWQGVTWGLVEGFRRWMLVEGYAVGSVNVRLSTVKTYAAMAAQAGALDRQELAMIHEIHGYRREEGKHIDELRDQMRRDNSKKAEPVRLTPDQAGKLKAQPDTPQGRRDRLLLCLMLDHGLRVGEVAGLAVADFDLLAGELHFYRSKVDKTQTHRLTHDTLEAARAYLAQDAPAIGSLWRGSRKGKGSKHDLPGGGESGGQRVNRLISEKTGENKGGRNRETK